MQTDVVIVGAGPVGLSCAKALSDQGRSVVIIDRQPRAALEDPAFDGREIAMTHRCVQTLETLGIWAQVDSEEISPLCDARVLDGLSPRGMEIIADEIGQKQLGFLLANHLIRRAAFQVASAAEGVTLLTETWPTEIDNGEKAVTLTLNDGQQLEAKLLLAADNRFSETRRAVGIPAQMRDFGKSMLVCRMCHEKPHEQTAWEWFGYGQTMAVLPLRDNTASFILTLPQAQIQQMAELDETAFNDRMVERMHARLGEMTLISPRLTYPLVGVYSERFCKGRTALIGDAAVGMHPVTAHGFNFGVYGVKRLTDLLAQVPVDGDVGSAALLRRYECGHRAATLPLYLATCAVVTLYTDDRMPARLLRRGVLRASGLLSPFKRHIASYLTRPA